MHIVPAVKEQHEVTVTFPLPPLRRYYTTKPETYISHLVGHEGLGSLLSALKVRPADVVWGGGDGGAGVRAPQPLQRPGRLAADAVGRRRP
jgi:hypothetical protein